MKLGSDPTPSKPVDLGPAATWAAVVGKQTSLLAGCPLPRTASMPDRWVGSEEANLCVTPTRQPTTVCDQQRLACTQVRRAVQIFNFSRISGWINHRSFSNTNLPWMRRVQGIGDGENIEQKQTLVFPKLQLILGHARKYYLEVGSHMIPLTGGLSGHLTISKIIGSFSSR